MSMLPIYNTSVSYKKLIQLNITITQRQWKHPSRNVSSSPYGRTHVWRRRAPVLPNPVVPKFPQVVIRSDGTSFTHWTTSPRSRIRLTRDTTNNPVWNTRLWLSEQGMEDDENATGRLGRFNRRFEGWSDGEVGSAHWMQEMANVVGTTEAIPEPKAPKGPTKKK